MTGFLTYGDNSTWESLYDPEFDGFAARFGVRSGDVIRAIEVISGISLFKNERLHPGNRSVPIKQNMMQLS
jgi:hypothetical protein